MSFKYIPDVGKEIRYNRIINPSTDRMVIIPLDHGIILGPLPGIENPAQTVKDVISGGVNSVVFNAGLAPRLYKEYMNKCGAIFNLTNVITEEQGITLISTVEYAIRNGADAVSVQIQVGSKHEQHMLNNARIVLDQCSNWGIPVLGMMYPTEKLLEKNGTDAILHAARAGAELGFDIVKTSYTGDSISFKNLVDSCPVPVVIAGGPKANSSQQILSMVKEAIRCGAAGVALGRNVWQHPNPAQVTEDIVNIVHHQNL